MSKADFVLGQVSSSRQVADKEKFPVGEIVYYITTNRQGKYTISFGIIVDHYMREICLQLYDIRNEQTINGIPSKEFITPSKWNKLPQGWKPGASLITIETKPLPKGWGEETFLNDKNSLYKAIQEGWLDKVQNIEYGYFDYEIDKDKGWRVIRRFSDSDYHPSYITVLYSDVYLTFTEAKAKIEEINAELKRQSELSDLEWVIEDIDKRLNHWAVVHHISKDERNKYRERLMALDNLESVEVRGSNEGFQWKYCTRKRWNTLQIGI